MKFPRFAQKFLPLLLCVNLCACNATDLPSVPNSSVPAVDEQKKDEPLPSPPKTTSEIDISHVDTQKKLVAFTFDDAPTRDLENILAVFAAYNEKNPDCIANATVFVNGCRFDPVLLYPALTLGFELGNHTFSHSDLTTLSPERLRSEIDETDALLCRLDGKTRHLLRAPFGKINTAIKNLAPTPIIDWTIDTLDWTKIDETEIFNRVYEGLFDGAIVLMHDGYGNTVSALKRLLPALKADGYQVVSVSQLAKAHDCPLQSGNVYIRVRKPSERK